MISPEMMIAIISSIILIMMSLSFFITTNYTIKFITVLFNELQTKIVELNSVLINNREKMKKISKKIIDLKDESDSFSRRIYKIETILYGKKIPATETLKSQEKKESVVEIEKLNTTEITILQILSEGPKSSKEIREQLKLSREHVARELKHLYDLGYLKRRTDSRPYLYELADKALEVIK